MILFALEFLVFLSAIVVAVFVYRRLVRSRMFTEFLVGFTPPPESDSQVIEHLTQARSTAAQQVAENEAGMFQKRQTNDRLRRSL